MGHAHYRNISQSILLILWSEYETERNANLDLVCSGSQREKPNPVTAEFLLKYFMNHINHGLFGTRIIRNYKDTLKKEDTETLHQCNQSIKILEDCLAREYGYNASEGHYFDEGMIDSAIRDCLYYWSTPKECKIHFDGIQVVQKVNGGYILTQEAFDYIRKQEEHMFQKFVIPSVEH